MKGSFCMASFSLSYSLPHTPARNMLHWPKREREREREAHCTDSSGTASEH